MEISESGSVRTDRVVLNGPTAQSSTTRFDLTMLAKVWASEGSKPPLPISELCEACQDFGNDIVETRDWVEFGRDSTNVELSSRSCEFCRLILGSILERPSQEKSSSQRVYYNNIEHFRRDLNLPTEDFIIWLRSMTFLNGIVYVRLEFQMEEPVNYYDARTLTFFVDYSEYFRYQRSA